MKRIRIVQLLGFVLVGCYIVLFSIDIKYGLLGNMRNWIFSILVVLIGINLICKGIILSSSSTMWFANNLILVAITILFIEFIQLNINEYIFVFSIIPIIPTFINLFILKQKIYIKVFILNASIIIPILIFQFSSIEWYWVCGMAIVSIALGIIICRNINLDKEKIDGKV